MPFNLNRVELMWNLDAASRAQSLAELLAHPRGEASIQVLQRVVAGSIPRRTLPNHAPSSSARTNARIMSSGPISIHPHSFTQRATEGYARSAGDCPRCCFFMVRCSQFRSGHSGPR
jgi:hypothetical protein